LQLCAFIFDQVESHTDSGPHLGLVAWWDPVLLIHGKFELIELFERKLLLKYFAVTHLRLHCKCKRLRLKLDRKPKLLIVKGGRTCFCRSSLGCKRLLGVDVEWNATLQIFGSNNHDSDLFLVAD
jgi:hypothetical protein